MATGRAQRVRSVVSALVGAAVTLAAAGCSGSTSSAGATQSAGGTSSSSSSSNSSTTTTSESLSSIGNSSQASSTSKGGASGDAVTLQFSQWWAGELPKGAMDALISQFEQENPGIKIDLVTNPYQNTHDSTIAQAATHNMSDIVAMDGTWYSDLQSQGALANMTDLMKSANYDDSSLTGELKTSGSVYMIPAVNFVYP